MPDWWEIHHGLDPWAPDHNQEQLSAVYTPQTDSTDTTKYDNLECYLNRLSDNLVYGEPLVLYPAVTYKVQAEVSITPPVFDSSTRELTIRVRSKDVDKITNVQIGLAQLSAPFEVPAQQPQSITSERREDYWEFRYRFTTPKQIGAYTVSAKVSALDGSNSCGFAHAFCVDSKYRPNQTLTPKGLTRHDISNTGVLLGWPLEQITNNHLTYIISLDNQVLDTVVQRFYFHSNPAMVGKAQLFNSLYQYEWYYFRASNRYTQIPSLCTLSNTHRYQHLCQMETPLEKNAPPVRDDPAQEIMYNLQGRPFSRSFEPQSNQVIITILAIKNW